MTNTPFARVQILALDASNRRDHASYAALQRVETALVELRGALTTANQELAGADGEKEIKALLGTVRSTLFGSGEPLRLQRNPPRIHR